MGLNQFPENTDAAVRLEMRERRGVNLNAPEGDDSAGAAQQRAFDVEQVASEIASKLKKAS